MVFLIPGILGIRSRNALALSFVLVAAIDPTLFAQVITWTSGFQNYLPPVFLMLAAVWLLQHYPRQNERHVLKLIFCAVLFVLGFSAQLYVEHSSLINVALALIVAARTIKDPDHHALLPSLILLAATILGLMVMLWIPAAFYVDNNHTTGYRSLYLGSLRSLLFCCARNFLRLSNHYFGLLGIPLCAGAAVTVNITQECRSDKANRALYSLCILPGIYMLLCILISGNGWYGEPAIFHQILAALAALSPLAVWIIALFRVTDPELRNRILVLIGFALFSLAPLLVVTPIHIRVVYHSQIFFVMAFMLCLNRWTESRSVHWLNRATKLLWISAAMLALSLGSIFFSIGSMAQARDQYILQEIENGADEVDIFRIPFDYVHEYTDSCMGLYYFRDEPNDIHFNIKVYDVWINEKLDSIE